MALALFPGFSCIRPVGFSRGISSPAIDVQRSRNGMELEIDWGGDCPRPFSFVIRATEEEANALETFFDARRGRWDPFNAVINGELYKVKFAQDELAGELVEGSRPDARLWDYHVSMVTVP